MESEPIERKEKPKEASELTEPAEAQRISEGIAEALKYGRAVDDETAWLIARAITPGSGPLHILAETAPSIRTSAATWRSPEKCCLKLRRPGSPLWTATAGGEPTRVRLPGGRSRLSHS